MRSECEGETKGYLYNRDMWASYGHACRSGRILSTTRSLAGQFFSYYSPIRYNRSYFWFYRKYF